MYIFRKFQTQKSLKIVPQEGFFLKFPQWTPLHHMIQFRTQGLVRFVCMIESRPFSPLGWALIGAPRRGGGGVWWDSCFLGGRMGALQCCGSKYIEFGYGSWILVNLDPNPILKEECLMKKVKNTKKNVTNLFLNKENNGTREMFS